MEDTDLTLHRLEFAVGGAELERLVLVCDDLEYLRSLPRDRLPSHTEVRMTAAVLRRLLIDNGGELHKIWRRIDPDRQAPLTVEARDLGAFLNQWPAEWIWHAWAGGAVFRSDESAIAQHSSWVMWKVPKEVHEPHGSVEAFLAAQPVPQLPGKSRFLLGAWLDSPGAAVGTDQGLYVISRKKIIDYVANRKGGVHFDPRRNLGVKGQKNRRSAHESTLLDFGFLRVGHLSGPEFEVVAVAQAVADSEWAAELVRIGHEIAPDEFGGDPAELKFWAAGEWSTQTFHPPTPTT